jgi:hypothetical protein
VERVVYARASPSPWASSPSRCPPSWPSPSSVQRLYRRPSYDMAVQRVVDAWMSFPYLVIILSLMAVLAPGCSTSSSPYPSSSPPPARCDSWRCAERHGESVHRIGAGMGTSHLRIVLRPRGTQSHGHCDHRGHHRARRGDSRRVLAVLPRSGRAPAAPSRGAMLAARAARSCSGRRGWPSSPVAAISLAVFGLNMLGDALRDVLYPRPAARAPAPPAEDCASRARSGARVPGSRRQAAEKGPDARRRPSLRARRTPGTLSPQTRAPHDYAK